MNTIFTRLLYELEKEHDTVLVTIVAEQGAAPGGWGSQMLVNAQERVEGTIGGGAVEKYSEELAKELLNSRRSELREFQLHSGDSGVLNMVCGGDIQVLFQFIPGESRMWQELAGAILMRMAERQPGWLVLRTDGRAPTLLDERGEVLVGERSPRTPGQPGGGYLLAEGCFFMPLPIGERVVIFGGGHCGLALVPVLQSVGFRVTIFDDRPEFARPERFPQAEQVIWGDYTKLNDYLTLTGEDYVVVMTAGHKNDFYVEEQVLRGPLAYIGVIGSPAKTASVNERLRERGIGEAAIVSVNTPIGVEIKAVTPEEIAVSIAGKLILVRARHREQTGGAQPSCPMRE